MSNDEEPSGGWFASSYSAMGLEFAGAVAGFSLVGWWIDRHWQIDGHWGVIVCGLLGIIGGMYNLIRQGLAANREIDRTKATRASGSDTGLAEHEPKPPKP